MLERLIELQDFSRAPLERTPLDMSAAARDTLDWLRTTEPGRAVELVVQPGLTANADPRLARHLLELLLSNAWKFTRRTRAARIEFGERRDGNSTSFFVADNGAGFDERFADKLFQPFQRLHTPTEFHGLGLGLAAAKRIVERHGGRIAGRGEPDRGAVFTFTL
jgi:signal transduction histidine kinase